MTTTNVSLLRTRAGGGRRGRAGKRRGAANQAAAHKDGRGGQCRGAQGRARRTRAGGRGVKGQGYEGGRGRGQADGDWMGGGENGRRGKGRAAAAQEPPPAQASVRAADEGSPPTAAIAGAPPTRVRERPSPAHYQRGGNRGGNRQRLWLPRLPLRHRILKGSIKIAIIKLKTTMKKTN